MSPLRVPDVSLFILSGVSGNMVMCEKEGGKRGERKRKREKREKKERPREREREREASKRARTYTDNSFVQKPKIRWLGDEPSMLWVLAIPIQSIQLLMPLHFLAKSRALKIGSEEWRDAHSVWHWVHLFLVFAFLFLARRHSCWHWVHLFTPPSPPSSCLRPPPHLRARFAFCFNLTNLYW
jgi:hypothetical protein